MKNKRKWIDRQDIFDYIKIFSLFSVFTGILYQFIALKGNLSFFSYSEVINDSIYVVPMILVFLIAIYLSYHYIFLFINFQKRLKIRLWLWKIFWILINILIAFLMYKYVLYSDMYLLKNNLTSLFVGLPFIVACFNITTHLYEIFLWTKDDFKWSYIITGVVLYIVMLSTINESFYKNLCFEYNDKLIHINYMNDKYVFLDNGNIYSIKEVDWFYRVNDCQIPK